MFVKHPHYIISVSYIHTWAPHNVNITFE